MYKNHKKERFFKFATALLSEKGYKAMTMRELAQRLDCDKSNIYNYINSKQELLDLLLFDIADKFHQGISDIEASSYTPINKLKAVIQLHVRMTYENPDKLNIHVNEWRFLDEDRKRVFLKRRGSYEDKIATIVQDGMENNSFKTGEVEFIKNCILSSIRWLYSWNIKEKKDLNPIELEKNMTDFILSGVMA